MTADVAVEITDGTCSWQARSTASGADRVTLDKDGYGAKHTHARLGGDEVARFRLGRVPHAQP